MRAWLIAALAMELMAAPSFARDTDANICTNAKDNDKRIAACTRVLSTPLSVSNQADNGNVYNDRANAHFNKGEYDQAIADYDQALKINPRMNSFTRTAATSILTKAITIKRFLTTIRR
jgi:tetratricopeptide (TPR) repeat protein